MKNRPTVRGVNGVVSALVACAFLVHALRGSLAPFVAVPALPGWVAWGAVAFAGVHVLLSVVTSVEQLTDTVRPPSVKKKQHLVLKWATGAGLLAVAAVHVWRIRTLGAVDALQSPEGAAWTIALAVLLAMHLWTGSKSLLKDLGIDRRWRAVIKVTACAFAALFVVAALMQMRV